MKQKDKIFLPLLMLIVTFSVWQFAVYSELIADYILPAPSQILLTLWEDRESFFEAFLHTSISAVLGFSLSIATGFLIATLMVSFQSLLRAIYPFTVAIQTLPIIALAPLFVIWFGYGRPTVVASTFVASVFPVISATVSGLSSTDKNMLELFRIYRANRWFTLTRLIIPYAIPQIFIGLRISVGLAVIGAVVGEFVGGGGLGSIVDVARTQQRVDKVFAAVVLTSVLGIASVGVINLLKNFWSTGRKNLAQ